MPGLSVWIVLVIANGGARVDADSTVSYMLLEELQVVWCDAATVSGGLDLLQSFCFLAG